MRVRRDMDEPRRERGLTDAPADAPRAPKKRGVVRCFAGWWFMGWWQTSRRAFFGPEARALATDLRQLGRQLKDDVAGWQSRAGPPRFTYTAMLAAWGIDAADVPEVRRMMRIARWKILGITVLAYGALVWQVAFDGLKSWGYLGLVALSALALSASVLVLSWRLHCLGIGRHERFLTWIGFRRPTSPR